MFWAAIRPFIKMEIFDALGLGLADITCESIERAFHDSIMPVQYIRQRRNRRISRIVPRHLREFVAQRQPQLEFQIIAHSVMPFRYGLPKVRRHRSRARLGRASMRIAPQLLAKLVALDLA